MARARRGKIAKLPADTRAEINRRLHDGQSGPDLLAWLHTRKDVRRVLDAHFSGADINAQNLSDWRAGGYQEWLDQQQQVDALKELSSWARDMTDSGTGLSDGAAAIVAGKLISRIETADDDELIDFTRAIAAIRRGDALRQRNDLESQRLQALVDKLRLDEQRWRWRTAEAVLKYLDSDKARVIARRDIPTERKTEQLGQLIFGEDW